MCQVEMLCDVKRLAFALCSGFLVFVAAFSVCSLSCFAPCLALFFVLVHSSESVLPDPYLSSFVLCLCRCCNYIPLQSQKATSKCYATEPVAVTRNFQVSVPTCCIPAFSACYKKRCTLNRSVNIQNSIQKRVCLSTIMSDCLIGQGG